jgi:predicted DNA-binding transcriptional regulator YafY
VAVKADRLLSALLLLQAHGRLSGRELAEKLEVSARTVHRDMEALSASGVPVFALRGAQGGWQLDEGWRTQVPGLDEVELRALLMAQPRVIGDSRLAAAAERALGKLMAAMPGGMREQAVSIRQRLYVDTTAWRGTSENLAKLPIVQEAVSRDRKLRITYRKPRAEKSVRVVDPLGLVAKGSTWYLVANSARGLRTFRVSRIESAAVLDKPCKRPAHFDLGEHWRESTEKFRKGWQKVEVTLRLDARAAAHVKRWMKPIGEIDSRDGWETMRVQFDHPEEALFVVLGLGAGVEVVEPVSLRERVHEEVRKMAERLATSTSKSANAESPG